MKTGIIISLVVIAIAVGVYMYNQKNPTDKVFYPDVNPAL